MAQQKGIDSSQTTVNDQSPERARTVAYNMLMRQSRKLGHAATRTLGDAKNFLQQDMAIPGAEKLRRGLSRSAKKDKDGSKVDELKKIVKQSHEIIAEVQTVFPVTLFPDKLCLDRSVITIIKRNFFWSSHTISVRVEDVLNVSSTIGPIFGSLTVASRVMNSVDHYEINFLWRKDAIELKHMIQGYMIAKHSGIEINHLPVDELVDTLRELGRDNSA